MKLRLLLFVILITALLATLGYWGCRRYEAGLDQSFTMDAVQVISMGVNNLYLENPATTAADIESHMRLLHDASVTHVVLDAGGKPVDLYGTPFQVRRDVKGNQQTVTATSAGPDRRFGTLDDISYTTTDNIPKKP